jgi:hypothetical protein
MTAAHRVGVPAGAPNDGRVRDESRQTAEDTDGLPMFGGEQ